MVKAVGLTVHEFGPEPWHSGLIAHDAAPDYVGTVQKNRAYIDVFAGLAIDSESCLKIHYIALNYSSWLSVVRDHSARIMDRIEVLLMEGGAEAIPLRHQR